MGQVFEPHQLTGMCVGRVRGQSAWAEYVGRVRWQSTLAEYVGRVRWQSGGARRLDPPYNDYNCDATTKPQSFFHLLTEQVSFLARGFEVEHQVFDIETKLRKGILNDLQGSTTAMNRIDDTLKSNFQFIFLRVR